MGESSIIRVHELHAMVSLDSILCANRCIAGEVSLGDIAIYGERIDGTLERITKPWIVDHISYLRTSMNSIPEGFSSGMWFIGEDVGNLREYIHVFTAPPGSVPDIHVISQMVDIACRRRLELTGTARRLTNRRKTEQRIAAKVCVASKFDWTWTFGNIRRFCEIVGWREDFETGHPIERGCDLITDIDVRQPGASLSVGNGDIRYCSFKAIDSVPARDVDDEIDAERMAEEFNSLAGVIESVIGASLSPPVGINDNSGTIWMLPKVVIHLRRSNRGFRVWMVNPRYLAELDGIVTMIWR
ncbi:DUF6301 family protein [Nocardia sp. NPDC058518]|uniref:DUF6301 family protein n=1 Tax=Nocardia sp. NPDC058518 TaxID=3346534 RepID=UPI0036644E11